VPVIFSAKLDGSEAVRYFHIELTGTYLGISRRSAERARADKERDPGNALRHTCIAITFAAMALEAFVNERAEDIIPEAERHDFEKLQNRFSVKERRSKVVSRLLLLAREKQIPQPSDAIVGSLVALFELRNTLVHYKLAETAGKIFLDPPKRSADGSMVSISFIGKPRRIEPPFLAKVTSEAAVRCYNTAFDFLHFWTVSIKDGEMKGFDRLTE